MNEREEFERVLSNLDFIDFAKSMPVEDLIRLGFHLEKELEEKDKLIGMVAAKIYKNSDIIKNLELEKNEWKQQHENLLSVRQSDLQVVQDLQQKLLQSQASVARLRDALETCTYTQESGRSGNASYYYYDSDLVEFALSTPPNTAELEAYVESAIERRLASENPHVHTVITLIKDRQ
jgi:hypothetical protein